MFLLDFPEDLFLSVSLKKKLLNVLFLSKVSLINLFECLIFLASDKDINEPLALLFELWSVVYPLLFFGVSSFELGL